MKITIFAVGKSKTEFFDTGIAAYQKRLTRWTTLDWNIIPASGKSDESKTILARLPAEAYVILLDERGAEWSTLELANKLETLRNQSTKRIVFIIGGAHGVEQAVADRAQATWSLSNIVFPHEQVRLIVTEQLYRAYDINAGGSYHHV